MKFSTLISAFLSTTSLAFAAPTPTIEERTTKCSPVGISGADRARVISAFTSSGVVPTLIPSINPKVKLNVAYGSKAVNLGNKFLTTETTNAPTFSFSAETDHDPAKTKYTLFLVDPDVPNPDAGALRMTYLHWEVANLQPSCITKQSPQTVAIYQTLTPASTQQHRYTFLVYRQPPNYKPDLVTPQVRPGFDVNAYAAKGGLTLVGGNFLREAITNGVVT